MFFGSTDFNEWRRFVVNLILRVGTVAIECTTILFSSIFEIKKEHVCSFSYFYLSKVYTTILFVTINT